MHAKALFTEVAIWVLGEGVAKRLAGDGVVPFDVALLLLN
jgi:hypothetical protein